MTGGGSMLLAVHEPAAFTLWRPAQARPLLLACDHASARIPASLGDLGVPPGHRLTHIAWDIGAGELSLQLARRLAAPAILAGYSRLVVDCNRPLDDAGAMPASSDGVEIPGNLGLDEAARSLRADALYWPYHRAIAAELAAAGGPGLSPVLIAIHSFTPVMHGKQRPWHVGVLWDHDPRLAVPLLAALREERDLVVGDNEPYSGREPPGFTIDHHAGQAGLAHVALEIRQDLLATPAGIAEWAGRLHRVLAPLLSLPGLNDPAAGIPYRMAPVVAH